MRPKVLVVEDDALLLDLFSVVLGERFEVFKAGSYQEAVAQLRANEVAAVVTDLNLGACSSGLDLARWIKARQPYLSERIILLTGADDPDTRDFAGKVMYKPVNMEVLLTRVERLAEGEAAGATDG